MKNGFVKVACATPSVRVADCAYNIKEMIALTKEANRMGASLVVFPELSVTGYSCGDLFLSETLLDGAVSALKSFLTETEGLETMAVLGLPIRSGGKLYNCAAVCFGGQLLGLVPKTHIPDHSEFYEKRYFAPAPKDDTCVFLDNESDIVLMSARAIFSSTVCEGFNVGVEICEDLWVAEQPSAKLCAAGASIICNLSASNETVGKDSYRREMVKVQSARCVCAYLHASCGSEESTTDIVFSGHNVIAENGTVLAERLPFSDSSEKLIYTDIDVQRINRERYRISTFESYSGNEYRFMPFDHDMKETSLSRFVDPHPFVPEDEEERSRRAEQILSIQAHGLAKRLTAAYAKTAVIGISGGLDSTLALIASCKAMDLLGRPRTDILGVTMPCFGTTKRTKSNAELLCKHLGVSFRTVNITKTVRMHLKDIGHDESVHDVVYENSQARERTQVIMDIANAHNGLVVGTGDLSELALGWATYNGDHMSMYGVNASVPKTLVRHIVRYYADKMLAEGQKTLANVLYDILNTPVSPELLPANDDGSIAQVTEDIVGPYELHDFYLYNFVRYGFSPSKLLRLAQTAFGDSYDRETLIKWMRVFFKRFFSQQFKRSCLPDGPKVGSVSLSPRGDWKMPSDACAGLWLSEIDQL